MTRSTPDDHPDRLGSVQILRGAAALLVLAYHLNSATLAAQERGLAGQSFIVNSGNGWALGAIGVDIFFIISGFVMAFTMAHYAGRPRAFLVQRLRRILPTFYYVSAAWLLIMIALGNGINMAGLASNITVLPLLPAYTVPTLAVGWTLSFEFAFYALVGTAIALRLAPHGLLLLILACAAIGTVWVAPLAPLRWLTHPILFEFALGVAAYLLWFRKLLLAGFRLLAGATAAAVLGWQAIVGMPFPVAIDAVLDGSEIGPRLLYWGLPSFLLFAALLAWEPGQGRPAQIGRHIGNASFSIYLTHTIVMHLMMGWLPLGADLKWLACFALCIAAGLATHRWIEVPMMLRFHRCPNPATQSPQPSPA